MCSVPHMRAALRSEEGISDYCAITVLLCDDVQVALGARRCTGKARTREGGGTAEGSGGMGARHRVPGQLVRAGRGASIATHAGQNGRCSSFCEIKFPFVTLAGVETEAREPEDGNKTTPEKNYSLRIQSVTDSQHPYQYLTAQCLTSHPRSETWPESACAAARARQ